MNKPFLLLTLTIAGATLSGAAWPADTSHEANSRFEQIKKLAGKWIQLDEQGRPTENIGSVFKVSAGGSIVLETLFPGTDHEMITIYHQQANDVVLTHYCVLGNQPRMKLLPGSDPDTLVFKCIGGGHVDCDRDAHMHEGRIKIVDDQHLETQWLKYENGQHTYTAAFKLLRKD